MLYGNALEVGNGEWGMGNGEWGMGIILVDRFSGINGMGNGEWGGYNIGRRPS